VGATTRDQAHHLVDEWPREWHRHDENLPTRLDVDAALDEQPRVLLDAGVGHGSRSLRAMVLRFASRAAATGACASCPRAPSRCSTPTSWGPRSSSIASESATTRWSPSTGGCWRKLSRSTREWSSTARLCHVF